MERPLLKKINEVSLDDLVHKHIQRLELGSNASVHHESHKERMELVSSLDFLIKVAAKSITAPAGLWSSPSMAPSSGKKNLVKKIVHQLTA